MSPNDLSATLSPFSPLVPNEQEGRFGEAMEYPKDPGKITGKSDPYPFNPLKYLSIPAKPGESFIAVLPPRKPDGVPLTATLVSASKEGVTLKITNSGMLDMVKLGIRDGCFRRATSPEITLPMEIKKSANP